MTPAEALDALRPVVVDEVADVARSVAVLQKRAESLASVFEERQSWTPEMVREFVLGLVRLYARSVCDHEILRTDASYVANATVNCTVVAHQLDVEDLSPSAIVAAFYEEALRVYPDFPCSDIPMPDMAPILASLPTRPPPIEHVRERAHLAELDAVLSTPGSPGKDKPS